MLFTQARAWSTVSTSCAPLRSVNFASYPQPSLASRYHTATQHFQIQTLPTSAATAVSYEHADLRPLSRTSHEAGQRGMMRAHTEHQSSIPTASVFFNFTIPGSPQETLAFSVLPRPDMGLTFLPRPPPSRPNKRTRAIADIDGEHSCTQKKKRRLRRFLITSRLSPQYSHPATNIVDRGSSKIAVWAKQRALGRNLLRKAAILNRIRRTTVSPREVGVFEQEKEQEQFELARLEFDHGAVDTYTRPVLSQTPSVPPSAAVRTGDHFVVSGSPSSSPTHSRTPSPTPPSPPLKGLSEVASDYRSPNEAYANAPPRAHILRRDYSPLPPSPLGFSNYDAFDADEDVPDPYSHLDDDEEVIPYPYDDEEEVPFSPSAITTNSATTTRTGAYQVSETPPQNVYSDYNLLDHGEPVFGDYDQVDGDADTLWPNNPAEQLPTPVRASSSPNFPALFTTSPPSKRTDSFATAPRPGSIIASSPTSDIITTTAAPVSPNFAPASLSPNFAAVDAFPLTEKSPVKYKSPQERRREHDQSDNRTREKDVLFRRFDT